ncbi:hypothetical protein CL629_02480 [bacterium]|nr:hypothetical protein [bacterium]
MSDLGTKKCKNPKCGTLFELRKRQPNQVFCTPECCRKYNTDQYHDTKVLRDDFGLEDCKICGTTFTKKTGPGQRYCSEECREKGYRSGLERHKRDWGDGEEYECSGCDAVFIRSSASQKYCTIGCRMESQRRRQKKDFGIERCWHCRDEFAKKSEKHFFCSSECVKNANRPRTHYRIFERDRFRCGYCGRSPTIDFTVELTLDHIVPWTSTRDNRISNIMTCCKECNSEKSNKLMPPDLQQEILNIIEQRNRECGISPLTEVKFYLKNR